jgi:putative ABC transport system permease protein
MHTLLQDLRYSVRTLIKSPVFTSVAVLTLALGIGANSAIFSVVNGVVLKPLEYRTPDRLVFISAAFPSMGFDKFWVSAPEYREYQEWTTSFSSIGAYNTGEVSINGAAAPIRVSGGFASAELFQTLGVEARVGRVYSLEEDIAGADPVMLLSHELWQRVFGADPGLVGRSLEVNGVQRTVIGVMPPKFDVGDNRVEAWIPFALNPANPRPRSNHFMFMIGRLAPGVEIETARAELGTLLAQWEDRAGGGHSPHPEFHPMGLTLLQDELVGEVRPALLVLLGAVGFVLLIACANVGNLLLARAESRQKEVAVRSALGAGRGRLRQQFLTESVVLSLIGGAVGLGLGHLGVRVLLATNPESLPRVAEITLDAPVLLFTAAVAAVSGVLVGLAPMLHLTVKNVSAALREGGQRTTVGSARLWLRRSLVVSELALAVVLVVGSGLMLRSFAALQSVDPGFRPEGLLTFRLFLPPGSHADAERQSIFIEQLSDRVRGTPGVSAVSSMSGLPPNRRLNANDMDFEGIERSPDGPPHNVDFWQFVTADYFETMEIPLVEGRFFEAQDAEGTVPVVLVNETMARTFWPGESPIGRRVRAGGDDNPWMSVVGVVKDVKQQGLDAETGTETYFYYPQTARAVGFAPRTMNIVLRTSVLPASLAAAMRETVWALDPTLPVAGLQPMANVLFDSVARPRFLTLLLLVFGSVALALAAVGTYGVMSYTVAERSHEMGIRMALGAKAGSVVRLVMRQGLTVAALGLGVGLVGALVLTKLMSSILFGVSTRDVTTFVSVPLLLTAVAAVACLVPARRATKVDPIEVLRAE